MQIINFSVSVPSTGRSGLQLAHYLRVIADEMRFSTLYGSKWVATRGGRNAGNAHYGFQYPLRVEVGCNAAIYGLAAVG